MSWSEYDYAREKILGLTKPRIREQLAGESDPKAIKHLTATREYLDGLSPELGFAR